MPPSRNLDVLRAIAVMAVLAAHVFPSIPDSVGRFGVLIFFVHTALVLMMSLEREPGALRFYIRRAFRIFPLSVLCITVVLACHIPYSAAGESFQAPQLQRIIANLLLAQNFLPGLASVSAPLWSLPFEIQMYALLPFLFYLTRKHGLQAVAVAILAAATVALFERLTIARNPWITEFFPCFMGGVLAYARIHRPAILPFWMWPACIGLLGLSYCATGPFMEWPACLALGFIVPLFRECSVGPASVASNLIARYSYGIYLSHMPIIWLCFVKLRGVPRGTQWGLMVVLLCSAPPLLHHFIEHPMIQIGKRLSVLHRQ